MTIKSLWFWRDLPHYHDTQFALQTRSSWSKYLAVINHKIKGKGPTMSLSPELTVM